jgi:DNA-binding NarL/FixJ family response regulator
LVGWPDHERIESCPSTILSAGEKLLSILRQLPVKGDVEPGKHHASYPADALRGDAIDAVAELLKTVHDVRKSVEAPRHTWRWIDALEAAARKALADTFGLRMLVVTNSETGQESVKVFPIKGQACALRYVDAANLGAIKQSLTQLGTPAAGKRRTPRRRPSTTGKRCALTPKQVEVVQIVGECKGNIAEAARKLGRDPKTIAECFKAATKKLGKEPVKRFGIRAARLALSTRRASCSRRSERAEGCPSVSGDRDLRSAAMLAFIS